MATTTRAHDPITPGEILLTEFLEPLGISQYRLAQATGLPQTRISQIVRGQDHLTNTFKHVVIFQAAGAEPPQFAHLPLLIGHGQALWLREHSQLFPLVLVFAGHSRVRFPGTVKTGNPVSLTRMFVVEPLTQPFAVTFKDKL